MSRASCIPRPWKQCTEEASFPLVWLHQQGQSCRQIHYTYVGIWYNISNSLKEFKTFNLSNFHFVHLQYKLNSLKLVLQKTSLRTVVGREQGSSHWPCIHQAVMPRVKAAQVYVPSRPLTYRSPATQGPLLPVLILCFIQFLAFPLKKTAEAS